MEGKGTYHDEILQQCVRHGERLAHADFADGVETRGRDFRGGRFGDELVGDLLDERLQHVRRHVVVGRLGQARQVAGDARLARGEVLEEVGVER